MKNMDALPAALACVITAVLGLAPAIALAADAPTRWLTKPEIDARYRTCPQGYYSGPQPGKRQYTKDKFLWVVTPRFAADFCMPASFVSTELHGVEAIAYTMISNEDEQLCETDDQGQERCSNAFEHHFEIYYKNGTIPKQIEGKFQRDAGPASKMLISNTKEAFAKRLKRFAGNPVPGAASLFSLDQFGLRNVAEDGRAWPMGALYSEHYYEELFEGIDFLALDGGSGFTYLPNWQQKKRHHLIIAVSKPSKVGQQEPPRSYSAPPPKPEEFFLTIELPQVLADRIVENDATRGFDAVGQAKRVLRVK